MEPLANGGNGEGRDPNSGRFVKGWKGGPGCPNAKWAAQWRDAFRDAVTPADIRAVAVKLVEAAKAGEPWAVREILDRCLGRPGQANERTEPLNGQPPVDLKVDVGVLLAESMKRVADQPLVPGLPLLRGRL